MSVPYVDLVAQHAPLREDILAAIDRVLGHGQFILGSEVVRLERELAEYLGAPDVVTLGSGTRALELALILNGVGPGHEVITVSHSFVATAAAIVRVGARPVFVDVDENTGTLDPARIEEAITERTRAVMPVHLGGIPCDMAAIRKICVGSGLALVEDCAQAIGARYDDAMVGSSSGTIGCFSLHPLKSLSACGDAGFICLDDTSLATRARHLRNNGLVDRDHCAEVSDNSRMDAIQAAIVGVKLPYLPRWVQARREHAEAYRAALSDRFRMLGVPAGAQPAYSSFVIRTQDRAVLLDAAKAAGFDLKVHYPIPIHRQPPFAEFARAPLPSTERLVDDIVSLPISPELPAEDRNRLIDFLGGYAIERGGAGHA